MTDITTIGEILIDLTQTGVSAAGVPQFAANPGGAPANVAVAASRLGAKTAFIGKAGEDGFGIYLRQVLEENNVDCSGLRAGRQATTMAIVSVDAKGERGFRFIRGADQELTPQEVDEQAVLNSKILHFGSVSLTPGIARNATIFAARTAHKSGRLVSYDPNYRPALWASEGDAVEWMRIPLPLVDISRLSEGVPLALETMGGSGVFCRWREETFTVPGVSVQVADTNGAGDTFFGAVLSRLSRRDGPPLEGLERVELEEILAFANRAAALTCSRSGAIPAMPALEEVENRA